MLKTSLSSKLEMVAFRARNWSQTSTVSTIESSLPCRVCIEILCCLLKVVNYPVKNLHSFRLRLLCCKIEYIWRALSISTSSKSGSLAHLLCSQKPLVHCLLHNWHSGVLVSLDFIVGNIPWPLIVYNMGNSCRQQKDILNLFWTKY